MAIRKKNLGITFQKKEFRRIGILSSEEEMIRQWNEWHEEDMRKLRLLCQHYKIDIGPDMYIELSLALARELYPEPKKPGHKTKWTTLNMGALVVEMERLIDPDEPSHGISWAAKQLARREPWKSFVRNNDSQSTSSNPAEVLRTKYHKFKDDGWADVSRAAYRINRDNGTIDEWEKMVIDVVKNPYPK